MLVQILTRKEPIMMTPTLQEKIMKQINYMYNKELRMQSLAYDMPELKAERKKLLWEIAYTSWQRHEYALRALLSLVTPEEDLNLITTNIELCLQSEVKYARRVYKKWANKNWKVETGK